MNFLDSGVRRNDEAILSQTFLSRLLEKSVQDFFNHGRSSAFIASPSRCA